jgi:hypothetical protein
MDKYDQGIGTATDLLTYYLRTAWEAAGLSWDRDNDTEVGAIIEAIAKAQEFSLEQRLYRLQAAQIDKATADDSDTGLSYESADEAVKNCPPRSRGARL